jgi:hypothetical protein
MPHCNSKRSKRSKRRSRRSKRRLRGGSSSVREKLTINLVSRLIQMFITLGLNGYSLYKKWNDDSFVVMILNLFKSIAIIATMLTFYIQASFTEKDYAKSKDVKFEVENHFNWKLFLVFNLIPIIEFLQHIYKKYNKKEKEKLKTD